MSPGTPRMSTVPPARAKTGGGPGRGALRPSYKRASTVPWKREKTGDGPGGGALPPSYKRPSTVPPKREKTDDELLAEADGSLLDILDHVLNKGVMLHGEVILGVADIDLIYLRLSAVLCAVDKVFPPKP